MTTIAQAYNEVHIKSESVVAGQTGVTVGVYICNYSDDLQVLNLPFVMRTVSNGAYIDGTFSLSAVNRLGNHSFNGTYGSDISAQYYNDGPIPADTCWYDTPSSTPNADGSPDAALWYAMSFSAQSDFPAGCDYDEPSLVFEFDANHNIGMFEIDTTCIVPGIRLTFYPVAFPPVEVTPEFEKGLVVIEEEPSSASDYTVGEGDGSEDNAAFVYSPFRFQGDRGEEEYFAHVACDTCTQAESGQRYIRKDRYIELNAPNPSPTACSLLAFCRIIGQTTEELGSLLISAHGTTRGFGVEAYPLNWDGYTAVNARYADYVLNWGFIPDEEIFLGTVPEQAYMIGVRDSLIINYGDLSQSLVYLGACYGAAPAQAFISANARVAAGNIDKPTLAEDRARVISFFTRMDGKECRENRTVAAARQGLPLGVWGAQNTTLAPAVAGIEYRSPIRLMDTISITFDTKCDTYANPELWCDEGGIAPGVWMDDSLTFKAVFSELPPPGTDEIEVTLGWDHVWSARNWACLDGNTDPWVGGNAEGPAHDDYVWTMAVAPCFCGMKGDMNNDGGTTPLDVQIICKFVYNQLDGRVYPDGWNCPYDLGDLDCDGQISPVDLQYIVKYVYKSQDFICEPCTW